MSNRVRGAATDPHGGLVNNDDRTMRYQSNPPKFATKKGPKGLMPSGGARKILKTNASQSSLIHSQRSLHNSDAVAKQSQSHTLTHVGCT